MSYSAKKVNYCYVTASNRAGVAASILNTLKSAGISLQAFSGFPGKGGKAQIDLVANKVSGIRQLAKKHGWKISKAKTVSALISKTKQNAAAGIVDSAKLLAQTMPITTSSLISV